MVSTSRLDTRPRVSATLIVRDESKHIDDCLASLTGVVDEIIVVDTGSRDDTVARASRYPVSLHAYPWCDDFSAARNFAIEQARGDWLLYIDADERLQIPDPAIWASVIHDDSKLAWRLLLSLRDGWTPCPELRLFRNHPLIRFRGVIHESVRASIADLRRSDLRDVGICDIGLRHIGYEGSQDHKVARNLGLLRAYLADNADRSYCWWHLGETLVLAGDEDGAIAAWQRGVVAARTEHERQSDEACSLPFVALVDALHRRGEPVQDILDEAIRLFPDNLVLHWNRAKLAIEGGQEDAACPILERLAAIDPERFVDPLNSYEKSLFAHDAPEALALCHFRAGRFREAAAWYRRAARAAPDPRSCELKARLAEAKASAA